MKATTYIKNTLILALFLLSNLGVMAQSLPPKFQAIHKQYYGKWPKTITFTQKTENYRADTLFRTQTWYEAGIFPDLFRIDIGDPKEGNAVIYRRDSAYNFRKAKMLTPILDQNILVYLLGGMFFETPEQVNQKLTQAGFDLSKSFKSKWKGQEVEVFGTEQADTTKSQLWYDAKERYLVRMIQQKGKSTLECHFEKHQKTGNFWHESFVKIFVNHKLVQTETYTNLKFNVDLNPDFFNPTKFGSWHWLK